jgi:hypothetical protein
MAQSSHPTLTNRATRSRPSRPLHYFLRLYWLVIRPILKRFRLQQSAVLDPLAGTPSFEKAIQMCSSSRTWADTGDARSHFDG